MGQGPYVTAVQRTGTDAGLVPAQVALVFDGSQFVVTDTAATLTDSTGASVGAYSLVSLDLAALALLLTEQGMYESEQHHTSAGGTVSMQFALFQAKADVVMSGSVYLEATSKVATNAVNYWSAKIQTYATGGSPSDLSANVALNAASNWESAPPKAVALTAPATIPAGDWVSVLLTATGTPAALPNIVARWHAVPA